MAGAVSWLKRAELPRKRTPGALSSQRTLPILRSGMRVRLPRGLGTPRRIDPGFPRSPGDAKEGEGAHRPRRARTPTRPRVEPPRERGSPRTLRAVGGKGKGLCAIWVEDVPGRLVSRRPIHSCEKPGAEAPVGPPGESGAGTALMTWAVVPRRLRVSSSFLF